MNTGDAVQQLLDLEAIKTLKHRYIRCMTQSRWDELQTLLAPDVQASYSDGKYVFSDRATLMGFLRQQDPSGVPQLSYWHVTMPEITLHAPDRASGIWAMYHFHLQKQEQQQLERRIPQARRTLAHRPHGLRAGHGTVAGSQHPACPATAGRLRSANEAVFGSGLPRLAHGRAGLPGAESRHRPELRQFRRADQAGGGRTACHARHGLAGHRRDHAADGALRPGARRPARALPDPARDERRYGIDGWRFRARGQRAHRARGVPDPAHRAFPCSCSVSA